MSDDIEFEFVEGTGKSDVEALLEELVEKKLAAISGEKKDEDFELLDLEQEVEAPKVKKKTVIPKIAPKKKSSLKLDEKRLVIEDEKEREEFDQLLIDFKDARTAYNRLDKEIKAGREVILGKMGDNLVYEGTAVLKITETPQSSVNAETVIGALVDIESEDIEELKAGITQILDLARMGIISIGKTDFERWIHNQGHDIAPFLTKRSPKKVIRVSSK